MLSESYRQRLAQGLATLPKPTYWGYATLILLAGFLWLYMSLTTWIPFDLAWDLDIYTVHDALAINSGQLPMHNDHPKFGMNLLAAEALRTGKSLQMVSVNNFSQLSQSPSPILCIAELVGYLRHCEALVIWLTLVLASMLIWRLFPRQRLLQVIGIPLLGLSTGMIYCSSMMRTEAFSIFFILLGLVSFSWIYVFARRHHNLPAEIIAWLSGGGFFGLALLTKLQAITTTPFMILLMLYLYQGPAADETERQPPLPRSLTPMVLLLLGVMLLGLGNFAIQALHMPSIPGITPSLIPVEAFAAGVLTSQQMLSHLKLQIVWLILLASVPFGLLLANWKALRLPQRFLRLYPLFWVGLLASFGLPLLAFTHHSAESRWTYFLQMLQSVLWTDTNASTTAGAGSFLTTLQYALIINKNYLLLVLAVLIVAGFQLLRPQAETARPGFKTILLCFFAGTLLLLMGSRAILRDTLWFEFLGSLTLLLLLHHCWQGLRRQGLLRLALVSCLLLSVGINAASHADVKTQIYLNIAPYRSSYYTGVMTPFGKASEGSIFTRLIQSAYGESLSYRHGTKQDLDVLRKAFDQGHYIDTLSHFANLPFLNLKVPIQAMGEAEVGFPAWQTPQGWARFVQVSEPLRGSLLIEPSLLTPGKPARWLAMNDMAPLKDRWWRASGHGKFSIFSVRDFELLLCLSKTDFQKLFKTDPINAPAARIDVAGHQEAYYALQIVANKTDMILEAISGYTELDAKWLNSFQYRPFFLIHSGNAWGQESPRWEDMSNLLEVDPNRPAAPAR